MNKFAEKLSEIFIDPKEKKKLELVVDDEGRIIGLENPDGMRIMSDRGVIDFVGDDNYAKNFGDQWSRYPKLQLDSFNRTDISRQRFWEATKWSKSSLKDKLVLDVGCGTGRFAEIALKAGAYVVALDYSKSTKVAADNLQDYENLLCVQGNIYELPFKQNSFDFVYCLGVLQHTPDVELAFKSLVPMVKSGGKICVDYYWKRLLTVLGWKYPIRVITSKLDEDVVLKLLKIVHPPLYHVAFFLDGIPKLGKILSRFIPVVCYRNDYPNLDQKLLKAWSLLDTYDAWAPRYDNPQTVKTVTKWANEMGLVDIEVEHSGHLVQRGTVPASCDLTSKSD